MYLYLVPIRKAERRRAAGSIGRSSAIKPNSRLSQHRHTWTAYEAKVKRLSMSKLPVVVSSSRKAFTSRASILALFTFGKTAIPCGRPETFATTPWQGSAQLEAFRSVSILARDSSCRLSQSLNVNLSTTRATLPQDTPISCLKHATQGPRRADEI